MFFSPENLTLCINNLAEEDSGLYEVSYVEFPHIKDELVRHQLIVQDMVPRPVMTVMPEDRSNMSAASCRITVNCSIQNDSLSSVCDEVGCRTSQKSFNQFNLTITILSDKTTVVCSGSNHVSTNNKSESYASWCFIKSNPENKDDAKPHLNMEFIIPILCVLVLCACAAFAIKCFPAAWKHQLANTSAALLIQSGPLETQTHSEPRVSTSSSSEAEPSYENVDMTQPRGGSSITRGEPGSWDIQGVDTVYSIPTATASCVKYSSSKGRAGNMSNEKALTSESATEDKEQRVPQIDTVYTVLQLPKNVTSQPHPDNT
ncbi:uncharacterized protein LOC108248451 isoform X2 [Kryptolebias marmoratus]|nr:uncharacterized protein LOC108248451 isoform X2 [Kryptolebias marmoratus]